MVMKTLREYEEEKALENQKANKVILNLKEILKKDSHIKKHGKVRKAMNIEEFLKLPTGGGGGEGSEGQDGHNKESASSDENNSIKVKAGHAPDFSDESFPLLGKVSKPPKARSMSPVGFEFLCDNAITSVNQLIKIRKCRPVADR
ncbi:hypothetical protein ACET3Z_025022 [Daucus carota]